MSPRIELLNACIGNGALTPSTNLAWFAESQFTLQGRRATFDDLSTVDAEVHRNLITVKRRGLTRVGKSLFTAG